MDANTGDLMRNRTPKRRDDRKFAYRCYKNGALQRVQHLVEIAELATAVSSEEGLTLLKSIAVHRADADTLGYPIHFAAVANCNSKAAGHKTQATFVQHRLLHQAANVIKHDHSALSPPPPPPTVEVNEVLEAGPHFTVEDPAIIFARKHADSYNDLEEHANACNRVTSSLNPDAPIFIPFSGRAQLLADEAGVGHGMQPDSEDSRLTKEIYTDADPHIDTNLESETEADETLKFGIGVVNAIADHDIDLLDHLYTIDSGFFDYYERHPDAGLNGAHCFLVDDYYTPAGTTDNDTALNHIMSFLNIAECPVDDECFLDCLDSTETVGPTRFYQIAEEDELPDLDVYESEYLGQAHSSRTASAKKVIIFLLYYIVNPVVDWIQVALLRPAADVTSAFLWRQPRWPYRPYWVFQGNQLWEVLYVPLVALVTILIAHITRAGGRLLVFSFWRRNHVSSSNDEKVELQSSKKTKRKRGKKVGAKGGGNCDNTPSDNHEGEPPAPLAIKEDIAKNIEKNTEAISGDEQSGKGDFQMSKATDKRKKRHDAKVALRHQRQALCELEPYLVTPQRFLYSAVGATRLIRSSRQSFVHTCSKIFECQYCDCSVFDAVDILIAHKADTFPVMVHVTCAKCSDVKCAALPDDESNSD